MILLLAQTLVVCQNERSVATQLQPQRNAYRSLGAAGAQLPYKQWVAGSNPAATTMISTGQMSNHLTRLFFEPILK